MTKHTAAPWNTGETIIVHANTLENLGASIGFINTSDEDRKAIAKANSYLIAAAPELLEALQDMVKWFGSYPEFVPREDHYKKYRSAIESANAAISKATGQCLKGEE